MTAVLEAYPDAYCELDRAAQVCGYWKPYFIWSHNDADMRLLGEGRTEPEAWQDAAQNLDA